MDEKEITCSNEQEISTKGSVPAETSVPIDLSNHEPVTNKKKKKAPEAAGLIGFIISAVAIVMDIAALLGSSFFAGGLLVILGITFSASGLKMEKYHGFAVAGLVLGIVAGLFVIFAIVLNAFLS